jgi:hypothetical protein
VSDRLSAVADVSFDSGGHVLDWLVAVRETLRLYEQLLLSARADVRASLSHQRWRLLHGEMPPRLRARIVTAHLTMALVSVRAAMVAVDRTKTTFVGTVVEPARAAAAGYTTEARGM